jgi:sec-independent protein translocase protein TatA
MSVLQPWHIFVLIGVLVLLFGAKKLPDAARSLGRSMRILKAETKGMAGDSKDSVAEKADAQVTEQKPLADNQPSAAPKVDPIQHN